MHESWALYIDVQAQTISDHAQVHAVGDAEIASPINACPTWHSAIFVSVYFE